MHNIVRAPPVRLASATAFVINSLRPTLTIIILTSCFVVIGLIILALNLFSFKKENGIIQDLSCVSAIEERIIRGNSLQGLIEDGQTIKVFFGHYDCNEVKRGDIVVYNYAGDKNPIIKVAKGLPGDKFSLKKTEDLSGWNIIINGEIVVNSDNQPYVLNEKKHKILSLYEESYKGIIPEEGYLILGNMPHGTIDSTLFGLVNKNDILGKVEI